MRERLTGLRVPEWARRSATAAERPWTVGIEWEVMLLQPRAWSLANRIDDVFAALPPEVASHASAETHACVVELRTAAHPTVAGAAVELALLRRSLDAVLRSRLGLRAGSAGTHPLATRSEIAVTSTPRYAQIAATTRALARREPTMAQHVHVAVPDEHAAVRALEGLRSDLPVAAGVVGQLAALARRRLRIRVSTHADLPPCSPASGIPRRFGAYAEYVRAVDLLLRSRAIPAPGFRWDARLQPRLGTVEVRFMEANRQCATPRRSAPSSTASSAVTPTPTTRMPPHRR